MIRRPPRATRTDTLFPYTTLFRSVDEASPQCIGISVSGPCYFPGAQMIRVGLPRANISDQGTGQVGFGNDRQHRSLNIGPNVHGLQRLALGNGLHARHEIAVERSEEHTSELQSQMRISYAGLCLKKKHTDYHNTPTRNKHTPTAQTE